MTRSRAWCWPIQDGSQAYRNDRFTGWVPAPGANGYLLPGYNYDSLIELRPVDGSVAGGSGSGSVPGWLWVVAIATIVVVGIALARRGRRRELEEA